MVLTLGRDMRRVLSLLAVLTLSSAARLPAQQPTPGATVDSAALAVYLDCQAGGCDFAFFQTELTAFNWVRDRQSADVHILVTGQLTGASGREYTVTFIGLRQFSGLTDTLKVVTMPAATSDDQRRALLRTFRSGLVRYAARTRLADRLSVSFGTAGPVGSRPARRDPWKAWVFQASYGFWKNGEETYRSKDEWGEFEANRVTTQWKTQLSYGLNRSKSEFELDDTTTFVNKQNGFNASVLEVKSLGEHWSIGFRGNLNGSTYDNFKRVLRLTPALEFNVFPYSASTRRQLRIEYNAGFARYAYHDTTIFDKLAEDRAIHRVQISASSREPWGSINVGVNGIWYLDDGEVYRIGAFGGASLRLVKGLNLNFNANYRSIHDQFYLPKKLFTPEQILTRQFQRGTTYQYWANVNLSYTFGSIFSTIVNPRFGGGFD